MAKVRYNPHRVSDPDVRAVLERIAGTLSHDVKVTSGDRDYVPSGGSKTSDHLTHHAADFHVEGIPDSSAFDAIRSQADSIFDRDSHYQFIYHGPHTSTQGEHLHVGHGTAHTHGVDFKVEGLGPADGGHYSLIGHSPGGNFSDSFSSSHNLWDAFWSFVTGFFAEQHDANHDHLSPDHSVPATDASPETHTPDSPHHGSDPSDKPNGVPEQPPVDVNPLSHNHSDGSAPSNSLSHSGSDAGHGPSHDDHSGGWLSGVMAWISGATSGNASEHSTYDSSHWTSSYDDHASSHDSSSFDHSWSDHSGHDTSSSWSWSDSSHSHDDHTSSNSSSWYDDSTNYD